MSISKKEAQAVIHSAYYRIVRQAEKSTFKAFYKAKVEQTVPSGGAPSGWSGFWWESLATEIQLGRTF